jgi:hypothetical protein
MKVEINICSLENYLNDEDEEYNKHCALHKYNTIPTS